MMLYYRTDTFDILTIIANIALLSGCAYEAWAIRVLTGHPVKRRLHVTTAVGIILVCSFTVFLDMPYRTGLFFCSRAFLLSAGLLPVCKIREEVFTAVDFGSMLLCNRLDIFNWRCFMPILSQNCRKHGRKTHIRNDTGSKFLPVFSQRIYYADACERKKRH